MSKRKIESGEYFSLDPALADPQRIRKEREKARKLKKTQWWLTRVNRGICYYCEKKFSPSQLTMDHIVPLARGGTSTAGNVVVSCFSCNQKKKLETPVERLLREGDES